MGNREREQGGRPLTRASRKERGGGEKRMRPFRAHRGSHGPAVTGVSKPDGSEPSAYNWQIVHFLQLVARACLEEKPFIFFVGFF